MNRRSRGRGQGVWRSLALCGLLTCAGPDAGGAGIAGTPGRDDLVIAGQGRCDATVVVDTEATGWERRAAEDLVMYIGLMSGARPVLADTAESAGAALKGTAPVLLVGEAALKAEPKLRKELAAAAKKDPVLRPDAIVLRRVRNRVYLAGLDPAAPHAERHVLNGEGHYYAVTRLLNLWGCRWYLPTEFGEVVPDQPELRIGALDEVYAPPFEIRMGAAGYAWLGDTAGRPEFMRRNFMNEVRIPCGHDLGAYVKELMPAGGSIFNVPIAEEKTIETVARLAEKDFATGRDFSLGMNDGEYSSDSALDAELAANLYDKYFNGQMLTDNFMALYNAVCGRLAAKYPASPSRIGIFAYVNISIPPQRETAAARPLVAYLAPIDIDPNHGMDDPRSPPKQEYREIMRRWAKVMDGRVAIYDYDQGMLVWRDLPNPSHQAFRRDVRHYRDAGILGFHTETRGAYATVFLNLYLRGQLMWNPDADVDALLAEFYPKFYGPAAEPMRRYWGAIYRAWEETVVTEHEWYTIPAIYTPPLVEELRSCLADGVKAVAPLRAKAPEALTRHERLYLQRMAFTERSFGVIDQYAAMVRAAATEAAYAEAVRAGERGLGERKALTDMNGIFTSTRMEDGPAWFPGEVERFRELLALTDGRKGRLIARLPLEWAFRRDPHDTGLASGFAHREADLTYWTAHKDRYADPASRKDYPTTEWEMLRSDLYAQAQGVLHPDWQSFTGFMWYKTGAELSRQQVAGPVRIMFPGLFGEAWLYVNGSLVAHRPQKPLWWHNDYRFAWEVDLAGKLKPGANDITLRIHNTHHNGGMFRRPFLYAPVGGDAARSAGTER